MAKEKLYIGTKMISAVPMDEHTFLEDVKGRIHETRNAENREGYQVTYSDGYISWSPKEVFETAYREVTPEEMEFALLNR